MRGYHHGNLRASLIDTGTELARAEGPGRVALREVARRAGVSHNAAYRHFADRDELLGEIARVGLQRLGAAMADGLEAAPAVGDPGVDAVARLRLAGRVYVEFALAEPGLFRTAFAAVADPRAVIDHPAAALVGPDPFAILVGVVDDLVDAGVVAAAGRDGVVMHCWSTVHGFATLHLDGPLRGSSATARAATLEEVLDQVELGLAGPVPAGPST